MIKWFNMTYNLKKIIIFLTLFIFLTPFFAGAVTFSNPFQSESIWELFDKITSFLVFVGLALVPFFIIVAAYYFMSAGGDPEKVRKAKKIFFYTILGLLILLFFKAIIYLIYQLLGISPPPSELMPPDPPKD
jgi:hypothetical protein